MKDPFQSHNKCAKLLIFFLLFSWSSFSQVGDDKVSPVKERSAFWSNVRFGGGIGLSFGDGFFSGTLAPSAIYVHNNKWANGIGLNLSYASSRDFFKSTILGGSVITLFNPVELLQLSAEFEELYVNRDFDEAFVGNADDEYWYPALWFGAGYRTGNVTFGIRYDVLYDDDKSIYSDPWHPFVRVYF